MAERFDLGAFYERIGARPAERSALRQDLVRGLKDYYEATAGYDRYGAETVLLLPERMAVPRIFGWGVRRILRDRRIPPEQKAAVALLAIDAIRYGDDDGIPAGMFCALSTLAALDRLDPQDARYVLIATGGEDDPLADLAKGEALALVHWVLSSEGIPLRERLLWAHSLLVRTPVSSAALIDAVMGDNTFPVADRVELCRAWIYRRQPHLELPVTPGPGPRAGFIARYLPFWFVHTSSWSTPAMMRRAPVWLSRLQGDPAGVAAQLLGEHPAPADAVLLGVADALTEGAASLDRGTMRSLIDLAVGGGAPGPVRRRFYAAGVELLGEEYLRQAAEDRAGSIRQWAHKRLTAGR